MYSPAGGRGLVAGAAAGSRRRVPLQLRGDAGPPRAGTARRAGPCLAAEAW